MKAAHPRITLLGNNAGRNLGDMAIMSSIFESLSKLVKDVEFYVPSTSPEWTRKHYGDSYRLKAVNVMPWTGSLRLLGIPTFWCLAKSDVALICDGIIFGKKLFNPAFNYLITLIFLVPWARLCGCKVVCYSCGIGPFPSKLSRIFARWVLNGCDLVIMREHDSEKLAREIGVTKPIEVTGDAAFINPVSSDARAQELAASLGIDLSKPLLGINVTKYMDSWLEQGQQLSDKTKFLRMLADGLLQARGQVKDPFEVLVFCTQPMDEPVCNQLAQMLSAKVITNRVYLSHDVQALMRRCQLLIGMRFHSCILASAVEVPIVGLLYAPKVRGYFRLLECQDYALELAQLSKDSFSQTITRAWTIRDELRARQKKIVDRLKEGAHAAARLLQQRYFAAAAIKEDIEEQPMTKRAVHQ